MSLLNLNLAVSDVFLFYPFYSLSQSDDNKRCDFSVLFLQYEFFMCA